LHLEQNNNQMRKYKTKPRVGQRIATWFGDGPNHTFIVIKVTKYTGKYPQWFNWSVDFRADTCSGKVSMVM